MATKDELNKLHSINYYTREAVEEHVVDINNKLVDICNLLNLDLKEIKPIHPNKKSRANNDDTLLGEEEKRAIVAAIELDEKREEIKKQAMRDAGITNSEYERISKESLIKKIKSASKIDKRGITPERSMPKPPPKTEWEKITIDSDEKEKIIESLRSNKQGKHIFSKDFKWEPKEFLNAFSFLEDAKGYTGPFITSVVDNKTELESLSKNLKLKEGIQQIYLGKYVILSIYDITADKEGSKQMYVGFRYKPMAGKLDFDALVSTNANIKPHQKYLVKEFLDSMDIFYNNQHRDLQ